MTDVGLARVNNEDSAFVGPYLALVADGVGGASAGEIASAIAVTALTTQTRQHSEGDPGEVLRAAVSTARAHLLEAVAQDPRRTGMATTLTAVATDGTRIALAHVGDSRAYLLHAGQVVQVSTDHTYVQQLLDDGHLDPARARLHPWRNILLRALPGGDVAQAGLVDVLEIHAGVGDRLLLCSDGLSDAITGDAIADGLRIKDPQSAAAVLVEHALAAGGADNVTCLVLDVIDGPRVVADGTLLGAVRDPANIVNRSVGQASGFHSSARRSIRE